MSENIEEMGVALSSQRRSAAPAGLSHEDVSQAKPAAANAENTAAPFGMYLPACRDLFDDSACTEFSRLLYGDLLAHAEHVEGSAMRLYEALRRIEAAGQSVLRAMDKYNEKNGTYLGGPPFFELGRSCAAALSALASVDRSGEADETPLGGSAEGESAVPSEDSADAHEPPPPSL